MNKLNLLIVIVIIATLFVSCDADKNDNEKTLIGNLIFNQGDISTIEVVKEGSGENVIVSDSQKISSLINKVKEIPVRRLYLTEETNFFPERLKEDSYFNVLFYSDYASKKLDGQLLIWPDGYISTTYITSMVGNQRTISYLSEPEYPNIYRWISDNLMTD